MELTYARYLRDEGLREELERYAHRERAELMHRYLAQAVHALSLRTPREADACHSYASR
jgi:hypothetical protein